MESTREHHSSHGQWSFAVRHMERVEAISKSWPNQRIGDQGDWGSAFWLRTNSKRVQSPSR